MFELAEVRAWLDVATGAAALIALIIGIIQLRMVRRSVELNTNLAVIQAERQVWSIALRNPDTAPALMRERWGAAPSETLFAALLLDHYETLFFQRERGAIGRAHWRGIERAILEHMASPAVREVWECYKPRYLDRFVRYVDRALAQRDRETAKAKLAQL